MKALVTLLALSLLLVGCVSLPRDQGESHYIRGLVRPLGDHLLFQACHDRQWVALTRVPGLIRDEMRRQQQGVEAMPIYIETWARQGREGIELIEPRVIGGGLRSCQQALAEARLQASGHAPGWVAQLEAERIRFTHLERLQTQVFKQPGLMREGHLWRWQAQMQVTRSRRSTLVFEIDPATSCRDAQGHWYRLQARVWLDGELFSGCARYGNLGLSGLLQRYRSDAERYLRQLEVVLGADGQAQLLDDYRNGQPPIERQGRWEILGDGNLLLTLPTEDGRGEEPLLWRRLDRGGLQLVTRHPSYGGGVELKPAGEPLSWDSAYRSRLP